MSEVQRRPVYVILPAGGTGQRFNSSTPKQYTPLIGQPLILYTLRVLHRISWIQKVYLAIEDQQIVDVEGLIERHNLDKVELVKGGTTRHASIKNCVTTITTATELGEDDGSFRESLIVILHDAVRPFVEEETYRKVVDAAAEYQVSGCMCSLVSTVLSVTEDGFMDKALDRSKHCASHTPQAFTFEVIKTAYDNISADDLANGTEALDLAWKLCGIKAKLVPAPDEVQKVTYRKDIFAAEVIAREQSINALVVCQQGASPHLAEEVRMKLHSRRVKVQDGENITDISEKGNINAAVLILKVNDSSRLTDHFPTIQEALVLLSHADIGPTLSVVFQCPQVVPEAQFSQLREFCRDFRLGRDHRSQAWLQVVLWEEGRQEQELARAVTRTQASELVTSLLFDMDSHICAQIFTLP